MSFNNRTKIKTLLATEAQEQPVVAMGWVRTFRSNRFIALNDGSTINNIQVVVDFENLDASLLKRITTGACLKVEGQLVASIGSGQSVEIKATSVEILGDSDPEKYPMQPKKHSLEFLRENAHMRFRTNTFSAVFRVRNALSFAIHQFFHEKGFLYLHTPIITASDAEGAGETFRVTTLDVTNVPFYSEKFKMIADDYYLKLYDTILTHHLDGLVHKINDELKDLRLDIKFKDIIVGTVGQIQQWSEVKELKKVNVLFSKLLLRLCKETSFFERKESKLKEVYCLPQWVIKEISPSSGAKKASTREYPKKKFDFLSLSFFNFKYVLKELRSSPTRKVDFDSDFFGKSTNLTVSGQLEGELGAMAFGDVYTFGPTFRAENSNTTRHLAEFWMIEPEMAFSDLEDNQNLAEEFIQYLIRYAMKHNADDLKFLADRLADEEKQLPQDKRQEFGLMEKLGFVVDNKFERITYTEAIEILLASPAYKKKKFQYDVKWGIDLQSEHERYLVEKHFKKPVIVTNYPKNIKAFYMRQNDGCEPGKETVAAMDILAPGIGEIVGGSQREERLDKLTKRMDEMNIPTEELDWYLDTRRYGACTHAGFGLGFERMVQFVTGMTNIRDVIPFARTPKNCEF